MSQVFNAYINSLTEDIAPDLTEFVPFRSSTGPTTKKSKLWRFGRGQKGSDIASAATLNFDTATGDLVDVTGTTTVTAITLAEGKGQWVRFTGILTLTHGASLVLPTAANIATAAGDYAYFRGYSGGVVRCVVYQKASGLPLAGGGGITNSAGSNVVTKSDGTNLVASQITDDGTTVKIGTSAADAGILGLPNNSVLKARNAANSGNIDMFKVNASDQLELAGGTFKVTDSGSAFYFESKTGADSEKAYLGKGHYAGAHLYSSDGYVTLGAQSGGIVVHSLYSGSDAVVRMRSGGASQPILRVHNDGAAQTADMQQWSDDTNATNIYSRINKAGYFMTRKTSAPADGDIATSELAIWFDNTSGAAKIKFKGKDSGGTVRTGEVALT